MYTIIMNQNKELITAQKQTIYQRESLVDKMQFLFPMKYEDLDLTNCKIILKYVDQGNVPHAEILTQDVQPYKDEFIRCILPIDTKLTRFAGQITLAITFTKVDLNKNEQSVLHTSETVLMIAKRENYYNFVPDESLEFVDQIVGNLDAKIQELHEIAETYDKTKADDLSYTDKQLQLLSNGQPIGKKVTIESGSSSGGDGSFDIVEF